jgi:N-acetylneuraminate synthase
MKKFKIGKNLISAKHKTYFIADIAANHDGSIARAKKLIRLCAKAGANAAKFQHFKAETIISPLGFKKIGKKSHQSKWKKSVFETYKDASINFNWTKILKKECQKNNIDFMTAPYDLDYVDMVEKYVSAYKIGSGDLNWHSIIKKMSKKKKPMILATGASNLKEVKATVGVITKINKDLILMQCNTNYSNEEKNFENINLNVLKTYKKIFKDKVILGLSDHTPGLSTVLGAVALGARVIEKHFTDNNNRRGPDHKFSMNFNTWKEMVSETRRLEKALGNGVKDIERNEKFTSHIQRRAFYAVKEIKKGEKINSRSIIPLRPYLKNSFAPDQENFLLGKKVKKNIKKNECIKKNLVN